MAKRIHGSSAVGFRFRVIVSGPYHSPDDAKPLCTWLEERPSSDSYDYDIVHVYGASLNHLHFWFKDLNTAVQFMQFSGGPMELLNRCGTKRW
jgi:hypothetical protein